MAIDNFPTALQPIIQSGYLEQKFMQSLRAKLAYRKIADREVFTVRVGETITKTRTGLRPAVTTPLAPSTNTNFDNGLTSSTTGVEQYTMTLNSYGDTVDLNTVTEKVGISSQFVENAIQLGEQAARSLDMLAANALFNAYLGGNTRVRTTLGSAGTTIAVDDIRGFRQVFANGVMQPVSTTYPMAITVNGDVYTIIGFAADGSNISTAPGGVSGTLTANANITTTDGTGGNAVVSSIAPSVVRANGRATTAALIPGDTLPMVQGVLQAVTTLRLNAVPTIDGMYNCYLDAQQLQGLFLDSAFQQLFRGAYKSEEYAQGDVFELMGLRFIPTNLAPQQTLNGLQIRRGLVVGKGALIEGDFPTENTDTNNPLAEEIVVDDVRMITRASMDRLQQIIAQSWNWIGAFCPPTDTTANSSVLPTATNAAFKRAVVIESL